ncbi:hypothetical protein B7494_g707 [Chlorociboria aeruginascens]|nr:hypothetical protein B7494_g707 [Chlorociboria aeruginascens]
MGNNPTIPALPSEQKFSPPPQPSPTQQINLHLMRSCSLLAGGEPLMGLLAADQALAIAENEGIHRLMSKCQLYRGLCLKEGPKNTGGKSEEERWEQAYKAFVRAASVRDWNGRIEELTREARGKWERAKRKRREEEKEEKRRSLRTPPPRQRTLPPATELRENSPPPLSRPSSRIGHREGLIGENRVFTPASLFGGRFPRDIPPDQNDPDIALQSFNARNSALKPEAEPEEDDDDPFADFSGFGDYIVQAPRGDSPEPAEPIPTSSAESVVEDDLLEDFEDIFSYIREGTEEDNLFESVTEDIMSEYIDPGHDGGKDAIEAIGIANSDSSSSPQSVTTKSRSPIVEPIGPLSMEELDIDINKPGAADDFTGPFQTPVPVPVNSETSFEEFPMRDTGTDADNQVDCPPIPPTFEPVVATGDPITPRPYAHTMGGSRAVDPQFPQGYATPMVTLAESEIWQTVLGAESRTPASNSLFEPKPEGDLTKPGGYAATLGDVLGHNPNVPKSSPPKVTFAENQKWETVLGEKPNATAERPTEPEKPRPKSLFEPIPEGDFTKPRGYVATLGDVLGHNPDMPAFPPPMTTVNEMRAWQQANIDSLGSESLTSRATTSSTSSLLASFQTSAKADYVAPHEIKVWDRWAKKNPGVGGIELANEAIEKTKEQALAQTAAVLKEHEEKVRAETKAKTLIELQTKSKKECLELEARNMNLQALVDILTQQNLDQAGEVERLTIISESQANELTKLQRINHDWKRHSIKKSLEATITAGTTMSSSDALALASLREENHLLNEESRSQRIADEAAKARAEAAAENLRIQLEERDRAYAKLQQRNKDLTQRGPTSDPTTGNQLELGVVTSESTNMLLWRVRNHLQIMVHERAIFGMVEEDNEIAIGLAAEALTDSNILEDPSLIGRSSFWAGVANYYAGNLHSASVRFTEASQHTWGGTERQYLKSWQDICRQGIEPESDPASYRFEIQNKKRHRSGFLSPVGRTRIK